MNITNTQQTEHSKQSTANSTQKSAHGKSSARGFTLIETLVAISVLLISLAGPLSIAAQALSSAFFARDQITAFYLAQEAIEYVRAVRDQNDLVGAAEFSGISECVDAVCTVDFPNFRHEVCSGTCPKLLLSETTDLFNHAAGNESIYTRSMRIESYPGINDIKRVSVTVSWKSANIDREFTITENLFDWL